VKIDNEEKAEANDLRRGRDGMSLLLLASVASDFGDPDNLKNRV
jgi:hypothetical protein